MRRRVCLLAAAVAAVVTLPVSADAGTSSPPWIPDATVGDVLTLSAWGRANGVAGATCTGTGAARRSAGRTEHGSFSCRIQGTGPGTVSVKALGPQWLEVTKVVKGAARPDRGIGALPKAAPVLESFWAGGVVDDTDWARRHDIDTVFCFGVGPTEELAPSQYLFGTYSCATFSNRVRGPQILVVAEASDRVRIVRQLAP